MLSAEQMQESRLKRSNISVNADATKQRIEAIVRPAKMVQKKAIRELAGVTAQVFHNIYSTGNISIKMVIAIAQTMNLDPFYLTGKADEPGEFTDAALRELLLKHGYRQLVADAELAEVKTKRPYTRRAKPDDPAPQPEAEEELEEVDAAEPVPPPEELQAPPISIALDEADLQLLLRAVALQAKAGAPGAAERFAQIQRLLLA